MAPEALTLVQTILAEQGVAWTHWWKGEPQTGQADTNTPVPSIPGADMTISESVVPTPYATDAIDYLTEEGFRPRLDETGDVFFRFQGSPYILMTAHGDATNLSLFLPYFWPITDAAERAGRWKRRCTRRAASGWAGYW